MANAITYETAARDNLLPYNTTCSMYLLVNCFTGLTDVLMLLYPHTWRIQEGGESPFDSHCKIAGCEVLTSKTPAYWDIIVVHTPWNQTPFF